MISVKSRVFEAPAGNVHKTFLSYVGSADATVAQFFAHLTPRQWQIAVAAHQGEPQEAIAARHGISQATVSRDLQAVRDTCQRFGKTLPTPLRINAAGERQLTEEVNEQLY